MIRLAALGLWHEANTFSTQIVDLAEMEAAGVLRGQEIIAQHAGGTSTMSGYLAAADDHEVEVVPLVMTTLVPSGKIAAEALAVRADELVAELKRNGPFDGVLVALHGAAVAEDILDVDGYLLTRIRETVGPDVVVGTSLDLHANISAEMCAAVDVLNTYRTNPHVDAREVAAEAADLVLRAVRREIRPTLAMESLPAVINILCQNTSVPPMSDLMACRYQLSTEPGLLSATISEGFPYADVPEMGMSVVVVTDDDQALAARSARALAQQVWDRRSEFDGVAAGAEEALRLASEAARGPVLLLDVGDNIGAGAPGDSVYLLRAARRSGVSSILTIIADPAGAATCARAGLGATVAVSIGGKTDPMTTGEPLEAVARVLAIHDGRYEATGAVHAGMRHFDAGLSVAVRLDTGQTVILMSNTTPPFSAAQLTALGLEPSQFKAVVAKGVHSPMAGYRDHVTDIVVVDTPGLTSANLSRLEYRHRRWPMFPYEPDAQYP